MSNGIVAPIREEKKELKPSDFQPQVRKVIKVFVQKFAEDPESIVNLTLKEACRTANVNYDSVRNQIMKKRQKGLNFWDLLANRGYQRLKDSIHEVDMVTYLRGLTGAHRDRELFYRRLRTPGFTDPKTEINVNIQSSFNTVVCPSGPPDLEPIDVEVVEQDDKDADT